MDTNPAQNDARPADRPISSSQGAEPPNEAAWRRHEQSGRPLPIVEAGPAAPPQGRPEVALGQLGQSTAPEPEAARAYNKSRLRLGFISGAVEIAALILLLVTGLSASIERTWASPARHDAAMVVLLYVVIVGAGFTVIGLAFSLPGRSLEIRYAMNRQGWGRWWWDQAKSTVLSAALAIGAAELVYALLRASAHWWLWAWLSFMVFSLLLVQLAPVLLFPVFYKFRQLSPERPEEAELVRRLRELHARLDREAAAGGRRLPALHGIYEWKLGEKSAKANAALTGWGASRRVMISDTLLQAASIEEIEAIFAHELGHHVHRDIWRGMAFQAAFSLLVFALAAWMLAHAAMHLGLRGIADIAGLPLLLLVAAVLGLAAMPAVNGFSRWMERRADDYSFEALGTATPLLQGLERLARQNLAEVTPARWKEWLLYSHPSIGTRLRRGRAWMERAAPAQPR